MAQGLSTVVPVNAIPVLATGSRNTTTKNNRKRRTKQRKSMIIPKKMPLNSPPMTRSRIKDNRSLQKMIRQRRGTKHRKSHRKRRRRRMMTRKADPKNLQRKARKRLTVVKATRNPQNQPILALLRVILAME